MGILWRRASRAGAVAGMLMGSGVCLGYMVANLAGARAWPGLGAPGPATRWLDVDPIAAGVFGVPAGAGALIIVSLLTPPPQDVEVELVDRLRKPESMPVRGSGPPSTL